MSIIQRPWWSLGRGKPVVPCSWQATEVVGRGDKDAAA